MANETLLGSVFYKGQTYLPHQSHYEALMDAASTHGDSLEHLRTCHPPVIGPEVVPEIPPPPPAPPAPNPNAGGAPMGGSADEVVEE